MTEDINCNPMTDKDKIFITGEEILSTMADEKVDDEDSLGNDVFTSDNISSDFKTSPRKFRNNSYYRAVGSELESTRRNFAVRKKRNDPAVKARALLYQQIKERGILDDTMDDDDDEVTSSSSSPEERIEDARPTWSDLPSIRSSRILIEMTSKERKRQEAMFELFTSEQSYLRSLNVLHDVFMTSEALRNAATSTEYHHLFSNVHDVMDCSSNFLDDLKDRIQISGTVINDVCDVISKHIRCGNFDPYVTYCSNEIYQQRAYQTMSSSNEEFVRALRAAERDPSCMGLPLHSFLLLPMQRVTRLPLLIDMIRQRSDVTTPRYVTASEALKGMSKLVKVCNERAKSLQQTEEMIVLQRQLEFKTRSFALVSHGRFLLKRGQLTRIVDDTVLGFRKQIKQDLHVLLFNDVIMTAKRKSDEKFIVSDYCYRHRLRMQEYFGAENAFELIMERNQDGARVVLHLQAESSSACARWVSCVRIATKKEPRADKNCVQVRIVRPFRATESDHISLQIMDVLAVLVATPDGWYYGERLIDGRRGWFPSSLAKEILNEKAREKNFRRGTRMLGIETEI